MLAPQAQIAAEGRQARRAGDRLGGAVDRAVERIALRSCYDEDDEPQANGDAGREAPRIRAAEAEVVEEVTGLARDAWLQACRDRCREGAQHEKRRCDRDA